MGFRLQGGAAPPRERHVASVHRPPLPAGRDPVELDAIAHLVDPALLAAAAKRAELLGVGVDEVVRTHDLLPLDDLTDAIAARLRVHVDPLTDDNPPAASALEVARTGVLRRVIDGRMVTTVAPRGVDIRRLAQMLEQSPLARSVRIASPERLTAYVRRVGAAELAREATLGLYQRSPRWSALAEASRTQTGFLAHALASVVPLALLFPAATLLAAQVLLSLIFLSWTGLRAATCLLPARQFPPLRAAEHDLPVYTIIVPLHREAAVVPRLVAALRKLAYPPELLDIKLVTEADDADTRFAISRLRLAAPFEEIVAPLKEPRTKPKALQAALPFARGSYVVVYDAEDEPDSDQLRKALAAFRSTPELACVQARLAIDNGGDGLVLSRLFAAEYAALFDVLLPAFARLRLPLPLGGSSNHFRIDRLHAAGGWDSYNVTEDADLGIRLARMGHRVGVIDSCTYEEAPARFRPWLRQRTRWFKGWIQTYLVHTRSPRLLLRELGPGGFAAFQLMVGGTVLAALVHPIFLLVVIWDAARGELLGWGLSSLDAALRSLGVVTLAAGYVGSALVGLVGLARRRMLVHALGLLAIPTYWLLLSVAAWRAVGQFLSQPYKWEKTEHGLARTSWRASAQPAGAAPRAASAVRRGPIGGRR
jgi:hypothetical protein